MYDLGVNRSVWLMGFWEVVPYFLGATLVVCAFKWCTRKEAFMDGDLAVTAGDAELGEFHAQEDMSIRSSDDFEACNFSKITTPLAIALGSMKISSTNAMKQD